MSRYPRCPNAQAARARTVAPDLLFQGLPDQGCDRGAPFSGYEAPPIQELAWHGYRGAYHAIMVAYMMSPDYRETRTRTWRVFDRQPAWRMEAAIEAGKGALSAAAGQAGARARRT